MSAGREDTQSSRIDMIARLRSELETERATSSKLRAQLDALATKVAALDARRSAMPDENRNRFERVEAMLREQSERIAKLGEGREKSLNEIHRLEQELKLISSERDSLREQLQRVEDMQTETVAFDDADEPPAAQAGSAPAARSLDDTDLPSIAELMAAGAGKSPWEQARPQAAEPVPTAETAWRELLPADLIVASAPGESREKIFTGNVRWALVQTDVQPPQEFPLDEPLMTVGRSESADIQVDGDFVSRIHARLLRIDASIILEDAGSKNGVRVNGERVDRWPLSNGDDVQIGSVSFRFVDTGQGD